MSLPKLEVRPTADAVAHQAASTIVTAAAAAIDGSGKFTLCLAGGSTPKMTYELLAGDEFRGKIEWAKVHIFFGDERPVGPDHADSNYAMAKAALLDHVGIPVGQIYRMKGEDDPEAAAKSYGEMLKGEFGDGGFDLLLMGMGDDGHTLSLFPHTSALAELEHRCVANPVEKLGQTRITITAPFANRSENVMAIITGENKAKALEAVLDDSSDPNEYPIKLIDPGPQRLVYLLDAAAAGMHE